MARRYSVSGPNSSGSATKTGVTIIASATVRPRINELVLGNAAAPADVGALYGITRFTAAGTAGSSPTPAPTDPADVASVSTAGITHSAEPTYTTDLLQLPVNQRATYRYYAILGEEFIAPATASNGLGSRLISASSALASNFQVYFTE